VKACEQHDCNIPPHQQKNVSTYFDNVDIRERKERRKNIEKYVLITMNKN